MKSIPFFLTLLSGLSTLLGYFFIYLKLDKDKIIKYSLLFGSAVMCYISVFDLIPESIKYFNIKDKDELFLYISIPILLGFIIVIVINTLISKKKDKLYKIGLLSMIAIIIHNIPEGIITYMSSCVNIKIGLKLTIAIMLHNIPEGITIAIPIYYSSKSKLKTFLYTLLSGLSEPLGGIISYIFLSKFINNFILGLILNMAAGIMITISITELLPKVINSREG